MALACGFVHYDLGRRNDAEVRVIEHCGEELSRDIGHEPDIVIGNKQILSPSLPGNLSANIARLRVGVGMAKLNDLNPSLPTHFFGVVRASLIDHHDDVCGNIQRRQHSFEQVPPVYRGDYNERVPEGFFDHGSFIDIISASAGLRNQNRSSAGQRMAAVSAQTIKLCQVARL